MFALVGDLGCSDQDQGFGYATCSDLLLELNPR
jgi:hypothetical protein